MELYRNITDRSEIEALTEAERDLVEALVNEYCGLESEEFGSGRIFWFNSNYDFEELKRKEAPVAIHICAAANGTENYSWIR